MADAQRRDGLLQSAGMLLGAWLLHRAQHPAAARVVAGLALAVFALAVARPAALHRAREAVGRAVTWVLLAAVYALAIAPTRALLALLRVDPLEPRRPPSPSLWTERASKTFSPKDFERLS